MSDLNLTEIEIQSITKIAENKDVNMIPINTMFFLLGRRLAEYTEKGVIVLTAEGNYYFRKHVSGERDSGKEWNG